jgi:hypothetical protein
LIEWTSILRVTRQGVLSDMVFDVETVAIASQKARHCHVVEILLFHKNFVLKRMFFTIGKFNVLI